ncbi:hypothetical protein PROPHIGD91-2_79 [Mycobacterium phage prophiGD91-2]|nr:hypothetical protein PROPHIGD91-2_79 [Mycobacterium phage prophiGD91-2]
MTIWQQICQWIRHPLSNLGALIAFRYCERNDLEIHFRWRS